MIFDPSGHGTAIRSQEVAKALGYGPVEKGRFDAAARAGRKAARINRRGGTFIQRHVTRPAAADFNATVNETLHSARMTADETIRNARMAGDEAAAKGRKVGREAGMWVAGGTAAGIGGGMTLGYGAKRVIDPDRKRQQRRRNQAQFALAKAESIEDFRSRVLSTSQNMTGIPAWRLNPISPLQQLGAANIVGEGLADIRSHNPFFRRSRTKRGVYRMAMGQQMLNRGVGEPL